MKDQTQLVPWGTSAVTDLDLMAYLRARYAEQRAVARAATPGPWRWIPDSGNSATMDRGQLESVETGEDVVNASGENTPGWVWARDEDRAHIAAWDPATVLADLDAKEAILAEHTQMDSSCRTCCDNAGDRDYVMCAHFPCRTLRLLGSAFKDRPDYQQEWTP
jgi:hypothetical protein